MNELEEKAVALHRKLWHGNPDQHLRASDTGEVASSGKAVYAYDTVRGAYDDATLLDHLHGEKRSLGVSPLHEDSTCSFGVLDIDVYGMTEDDADAIKKKLVIPGAAFWSKSRGIQFYVFTTAPVPATLMVDYLKVLRRRLTKKMQSDTELFPKQTQWEPDTTPSAVNFPMFGQKREPVFVCNGTEMLQPADMTSIIALLDALDRECRTSPEHMAEIVQSRPETADPNSAGYRVPHDSPGRNDLLMRIACSMQSRGWPNDALAAEIRRLNQMFARFNRSLFGTTFVCCEESIFHGSDKQAATLKSFISSGSWAYEEKFKATFPAKNVHRVIATTNHEQAIHLDSDDRRWTVIDVPKRWNVDTPEGKAEALAFWEPYYQFMRADGPRIVLDYLLKLDVDRSAIMFGHGTSAKQQDKLASDPVLQALDEIAANGCTPHDDRPRGIVSITTLHLLARRHGLRQHHGPEFVSQRVLKLLPEVKRLRTAKSLFKVHTITDDSHAFNVAIFETRQRGFYLGELASFREEIAKLTGGEYDDNKKAWEKWETPSMTFEKSKTEEIDPDDIPF